ncbi:MAG TPA: AAA family ATPase [Burkholderiales bacterium]|jgi:MSHA biogenesis protein MshM|nr:AAA family ATPase [Burkholderiales bacterium]
MNYLAHFGLREPPFGITPDTSYFYCCCGSQEALNTLLVAIANGDGFVKVTGEVGAGKTLLCRKLLATLDESWVTCYIPNPSFEPRTLMLALAEELELPVDAGVDQHHLLRAITKALLDMARLRKRVLVCIDESQSMPLETLEALRLLTNLETEKRKLLQVVLFGQPELDRKLSSPSIRQLRQRIMFEHRLEGLAEHEVGAYVAHRLAVAGHAGAPLLSASARRTLHRASRGLPRLINILMHKAMLLAYGEGAQALERRHLRGAIADTPSASRPRPWWWLLPRAA